MERALQVVLSQLSFFRKEKKKKSQDPHVLLCLVSTLLL